MQNICIRWNFIYLMLRRAYQLHDFINFWIKKLFDNQRIQCLKVNKNKKHLILLIDNMLNSFYEYILIVSKTIQIDIHLRFCIFNYMFDYLKELKNISTTNTVFLQRTTVIKTCQAILNKFSKYYSKIKDSNETLYNLVNILNFTQRLNIYKI